MIYFQKIHTKIFVLSTRTNLYLKTHTTGFTEMCSLYTHDHVVKYVCVFPKHNSTKYVQKVKIFVLYGPRQCYF